MVLIDARAKALPGEEHRFARIRERLMSDPTALPVLAPELQEALDNGEQPVVFIDPQREFSEATGRPASKTKLRGRSPHEGRTGR